MEYLLLNSHREEGLEDEDEAAGEGKIHVGSFSDPELGEVSISAVVLKRDLPGWLKPQNSSDSLRRSSTMAASTFRRKAQKRGGCIRAISARSARMGSCISSPDLMKRPD
jgi:hypothetical protein